MNGICGFGMIWGEKLTASRDVLTQVELQRQRHEGRVANLQWHAAKKIGLVVRQFVKRRRRHLQGEDKDTKLRSNLHELSEPTTIPGKSESTGAEGTSVQTPGRRHHLRRHESPNSEASEAMGFAAQEAARASQHYASLLNLEVSLFVIVL